MGQCIKGKAGVGLPFSSLYFFKEVWNSLGPGELDHTEVTEVTEVFKDFKRWGEVGNRSGADNFDISSVTFVTSV